MSDANPNPTRRRWPRRAALATLLVAGLACAAPLLAGPLGVYDRVGAELSRATGGNVAVGGGSLGWFAPVRLTDVRWADAGGDPWATVESVELPGVPLWKLLTGTKPERVELTRPAVQLAVRPGGSNVEDALRPILSRAGGGERAPIAVQWVEGRLTVTHACVPTTLRVDGSVTVPASGPIRVAAEADGKSLLVAADADAGQFRVQLKADGAPLALAEAAATRFGVTVGVAGTFGADVTATGGPDSVAVRGKLWAAGADLVAGPDRVRLAAAELPLDAEWKSGRLYLRQAEFRSDLGTLRAAGTFDPSAAPEAHAGIDVAMRVELAKVAAQLPRLLSLRDGVRLDGGELAAELRSEPGPDGVRWSGGLRASGLRGAHNGKPLEWNDAIKASFAGRLDSRGRPLFDKLECQSDFLGLAARGGPDDFFARANVNLDRLHHRLAEFVDFGPASFGGTAAVQLQSTRGADGHVAAKADVAAARVRLTDARGRQWEEPDLKLTLDGEGAPVPGGARVARGVAEIACGTDRLRATLREPLSDALAPKLVHADWQFSGSLEKWWNRLTSLTGMEPTTLAGTGTLAGTLRVDAEAARVGGAKANMTAVRWRGYGVSFDQPTVQAGADVVVNSSGGVRVSPLRWDGPQLRLTDWSIGVGGGAVDGGGATSADLAAVLRAVGAAPPVGGRADGQVRFRVDSTGVPFTWDGTVRELTVGPPERPTWREPSVAAVARGRYAAGALGFDQLTVRRDGLDAEAKGAVTGLGAAPSIDVSGTLGYDLARLQPTLREYLGPAASAEGKDRRPFRLSGPLAGPGPGLELLRGEAAVAWDKLNAYGFSVGKGELSAALEKGEVRFSPVRAAFAEGAVQLTPALDLRADPPALVLAPGRAVERARLSPAAAAGAVGFALPALANAAELDGFASLDLSAARVPLGRPNAATMAGTITVHTATVTPGPSVAEIVGLIGAQTKTRTLATDQKVNVKVENGRVWHDRFEMTVERTTVRTGGSVGLDGTLAIVVETQLPPKLLEQWFKNSPRLREAAAQQWVKLPVGGTLKQPRLDRRAWDRAVADAARGTGRELLGDLLQQGLQKALPPPKK